MTHFQLVAVSLFVVSLVLANGKTILNALSRAGSFVFRNVHLPTFTTESPNLSARERVRDLVTVSELRDRLSAVGCATGVEACTLLLRSIVDHPADCQK